LEVESDLAVSGSQFFGTLLEAIQLSFPLFSSFGRVSLNGASPLNFLSYQAFSFPFAQVFLKNKARQYVAVLQWSVSMNCSLFFQPASYAIEGLVCEFVGVQTILAIKVSDKTTPHFEKLLVACACALINPVEETLERSLRERPP
jgi:hypothetical protein